MNLRHLRYFVALTREGNHARAAAACNVAQPTLSTAIRQLEQDLGVPLIDRAGQRYRGLTPEGERVLEWAERLLADEDALNQEIAELRQGLSGVLRLGIIPAAMPVAPLLTNPFSRNYPQVTIRLSALTSIEIEAGLTAGTLEAGVTYLDNEPLRAVRKLPLYREHYVLLTPRGGPFDHAASVTWREAARLPLCLLSRKMQNRRIMDSLFAETGVEPPRIALETNSVLALVAHVRSGHWSSVIPHTFLPMLGPEASREHDTIALPLTDPRATRQIGIVVTDREPLPPLARAVMKTAREKRTRDAFAEATAATATVTAATATTAAQKPAGASS